MFGNIWNGIFHHRIDIVSQVLGAIGLFACNIARVYATQYSSAAGFAFTVTLILLLLIICKASLRNSDIFQKVEIIVCAILTIVYVAGTVDVFKFCWYYLFDNFQLGHFIGSLIATVNIKLNSDTSQMKVFLYFIYPIIYRRSNWTRSVLFWPRSLMPMTQSTNSVHLVDLEARRTSNVSACVCECASAAWTEEMMLTMMAKEEEEEEEKVHNTRRIKKEKIYFRNILSHYQYQISPSLFLSSNKIYVISNSFFFGSILKLLKMRFACVLSHLFN